jgi:hypothetical protein
MDTSHPFPTFVVPTPAGGDFPDDEAAMFKLLALGMRYGCEYIDMECCWSLEARTAFLQYKQAVYPGRLGVCVGGLQFFLALSSLSLTHTLSVRALTKQIHSVTPLPQAAE